jgi:hypothetical protein
MYRTIDIDFGLPKLSPLCRVKFQTQEVVNGQIRENALVSAAKYALENTALTLCFMAVPPLLKPVLYPLIRRFPPPRLQKLNIARMQLYTAATTLADNAMQRLGITWKDELNLMKAFGELLDKLACCN